MNKGNNDVDEELEKIRRKKIQELKFRLTHPEEQKKKVDTKGQIIFLNILNFWETMRQSGKLIIECYADWCRPCKELDPILRKLADIHRDIVFAKLDIDKATTISNQFQIQGVPTILFFRNGQFVDKLVGALPLDIIEANIQKSLS